MQKQFKLSILTLAIGALGTQMTYAAEDTDNHSLPRITLKASKKDGSNSYIPKKATASKIDAPINEVAQSISVITRETMDDQLVQNINEALRYSAGVLPNAYGIESRYDWPFIRGYTAIGDTWRDGLRQTNIDFVVPRINQYGIEQVEVIKGPASVLYGQANPGGLVSLSTKKPTDKPLREVGTTVGSYNNVQLYGDISDSINSDWKYRFTAIGRNAETQQNHSRDDSVYLAPSLSWNPDDNTSLIVQAQYQQDKQGTILGGTPAPYLKKFFAGVGLTIPDASATQNLGNPDYDRFNREYAAIGYNLSHRFNSTWEFKQNVRFEHMDLDYKYALLTGVMPDPATFKPVLVQMAADVQENADVLAMDQHFKGSWGNQQFSYSLTTGVDLFWLNSDQDEKKSAGTYNLSFDTSSYPVITQPTVPVRKNTIENKNVGVYALNQFKFDERVIVNVSGRHDWNDRHNKLKLTSKTHTKNEGVFTGQVSAMYLFDNGVSPYISYGTGFTPSNETDVDGSLLKSEKSRQVEGGVKWLSSDNNFLISAAIYQLIKENIVRRHPLTQKVIQTGEVESRGLELESSLNLPYGFQLKGSYTYNDAEITKDSTAPEREGTTPFLNPKQQANLWLNYKAEGTAVDGLTLGAGIRFIGKMDYLEDNAVDFGVIPGAARFVPIHVDSRTFIDAAIGYNWRNWSANFKVNNLTDKESFSWCTSQICNYDPERNYVATVKYRW